MTLDPRSRRAGSVLIARLGPAVLLVVCLLAVLGLALASPVASHAQLVAVEPADGALLDTAPSEVRVTFSEPVGLASGGLRVIDSGGVAVDAGEDVVAGATISQTLPDLPDGWYVVTWGIVSEDGHVVRASSLFGVGDVEGAVSGQNRTVADPVEMVVGPARALMDLALLVAMGAWVAWWRLGARTLRVRRLAFVALAVALVASLAWSAAQALDGGESWLETPAALAAAIRLMAIVVALAAGGRRPWLATMATVVALLTVVGGGHTTGTTGSLVASLLLMVHLLAASTWLGAGPAVLLVLTDRAVDDGHALAVVRRFSSLAPFVLITVGVAGIVLALLVTDRFAGGLDTPYVLILAAKVSLVAVAVLLGLLARRRLRGTPPRATLRRVFVVDAVLLPLIVIASAALTLNGAQAGRATTGPGVAGAGPVRCVATAEPLSLTVLATPGIPGRNELRISGVPGEALEVGLEVTHPATSDAPITFMAEAVDDAWVAAGVLPLEGAWEATVAVRLDTFTEVRGSCALTLGSHGARESVPASPAATMAASSTPGLSIGDAWVRETMMPGMAGAAYLLIDNDTGVGDALVGVSSPSAEAVELHRTTTGEDGSMAMAPVAEIPIPAGGRLALEPGGYHLMLVGASEPFVAGAEVELTLTFAESPAQTIRVPVLADRPAGADHGHE